MSGTVIVQGQLVGDKTIRLFQDDMNSVAGWPADQKIDKITKIEVSHGDIIDGISITYRLKGGALQRVTHGDDFGAGKATAIDLKDTEEIASMQGRAEFRSTPYGPCSFTQISFTIWDKTSNTARITPLFGTGPPQNTFELAGPIGAFFSYKIVMGQKPYLSGLSPVIIVNA